MSDEAPSEGEARPEPEEAKADAPSSAEAAPDEPKPKKKKKKKADAESEAPSDPRAKEIAVAFEVGNFQRVRELGAELVKSGDAALADVGRDYLGRVAVDPVQIAFLGLCAIALLTIAWIYVPH